MAGLSVIRNGALCAYCRHEIRICHDDGKCVERACSTVFTYTDVYSESYGSAKKIALLVVSTLRGVGSRGQGGCRTWQSESQHDGSEQGLFLWWQSGKRSWFA